MATRDTEERERLIDTEEREALKRDTQTVLETRLSNLSEPEETLILKTPKIYKNILYNATKIGAAWTYGNLTTQTLYVLLLKEESSVVQGAAQLSILLMNITGVAIFFGLNQALLNRFSHVYGAKDYKQLGLYIHRGVIINIIVSIVLGIIIHFSPLLFLKLGYDEAMISQMAIFFKMAVFANPFYGIYQVFVSYLNVIGNFTTGMQTQIFTGTVSIITGVILIKYYHLGILGAGICYLTQNALGAIILASYCYIKDPIKGSMIRLEKASFEGLWPLFIYLMKGGGQIFLEWIGLDAMVTLSGILKNQNQCYGLLLSLNVINLVFGMVHGINISTSSFVGKCMGAKKKLLAQKFAEAGVISTQTYTLIIGILSITFRKNIAEFYNDDPESQLYMAISLVWMMIIFQVESFQYMLGTILRAVKLEDPVVKLTLLNMYGLSIPIMLGLLFWAEWEVYAILMGLFLNSFLNSIWFVFLFVKLDWDRQLLEVKQVVNADCRFNVDESTMLIIDELETK